MVMAGCLYQIHRCRQGVWFRHGADSVFMTGLCRRARHSKNRGAFCSQELVHCFRHPVRTASYPVMLVIVFFYLAVAYKLASTKPGYQRRHMAYVKQMKKPPSGYKEN